MALSNLNGTDDDSDSNDLDKLLLLAEEVELKGKTEVKEVSHYLQDDDSFIKDLEESITSKKSINKENEKTVLEELDSSDDEDARNFLERKYNDYGKEINEYLKQNVNVIKDATVTREVNKTYSGNVRCALKNTSNNNKGQSSNQLSESFSSQKKQKSFSVESSKNEIDNKKSSSVLTDPVFGMRIFNPLVSSTVLLDRMEGKSPISLSNLVYHIEYGDLKKDWVIAGVVLNKSQPKTAKNGSMYSIWKLSDLKGDIKTFSLFLFKSGHKELWKISVGTIVAILNPNILEKKQDRSDIACISIDNSQKVMILGKSKDYGLCKAKKKNGDNCNAVINLSQCDVCIYHIKQEYGQLSRRSELQSATAGRGLHDLRNKVLGKSEVFYGGKSYTAIPAVKNTKLVSKDQHRLMTLSEYFQSPNSSMNEHKTDIKNKEIPYAKKTGPSSKIAGSVQVTAKQRNKDIERLKLLKGTNNDDDKQSEEKIEKTINNTIKNLPVPKLSQESFTVDINFSNKKAELSRLKAIEIVKMKPIQKSNPNFVKYRGTKEGKRRAIDDLNDINENDKKKQKLEEIEYDRKSRIEKIINATSKHQDLIKTRQNEEQDKYFNKLERKEILEEKMLNTFKIACKAVICLKCKYTSFSAADNCKISKHPLKVIDAVKRFFSCGDCGNRTVTVHKIPKLSCKNCHGSKWQKAAMIRDKTNQNPNGVILSIRGDEEKFFGSLNTSANLNLLVPE